MTSFRLVVAAACVAVACPAWAQVNNGPGIGPSSELERPDLARAEQRHPPAHKAPVPKAKPAGRASSSPK